MLKKLLSHQIRILLVMTFIFLLVLVRAYEDSLFYDPFLDYFKRDFAFLPLPEINSIQLVFGLFLRYGLNTVFSLGIIYMIFKDFELIKFTSVLYSFFFIILTIAFLVVLSVYGAESKMTLFYIRRFLIQPIFLLLFVPAFFYQKKNS
jgi:exosortase F-associated protein